MMTVDPEDIRSLALKIRYDLTSAQAKLTNLLDLIALLPAVQATGKVLCPEPHCGLSFTSTMRLGEHLENVHGVLPFVHGKENRERQAH